MQSTYALVKTIENRKRIATLVPQCWVYRPVENIETKLWYPDRKCKRNFDQAPKINRAILAGKEIKIMSGIKWKLHNCLMIKCDIVHMAVARRSFGFFEYYTGNGGGDSDIGFDSGWETVEVNAIGMNGNASDDAASERITIVQVHNQSYFSDADAIADNTTTQKNVDCFVDGGQAATGDLEPDTIQMDNGVACDAVHLDESLVVHSNDGKCDCCQACKKVVNNINRDVQEIKVLLKQLLATNNGGDNGRKTTENDQHHIGFNRLPIQDPMQLVEFNQQLLENRDFKKFIIDRFASVGGLTETLLVSRILDVLISGKCLHQISWKGKLAFKHFAETGDTIEAAVMKAFPNSGRKIRRLVMRAIRDVQAKIEYDTAKCTIRKLKKVNKK